MRLLECAATPDVQVRMITVSFIAFIHIALSYFHAVSCIILCDRESSILVIADCEYREPGGGYRMADQSSSRPKWIPAYDHREFQSGKEHTTKWSTEIFTEGPAVTKEQFVSRLINMQFSPPLGGPYLAASAAAIEDETAAATLFDVLAQGKEKLTKHRMSTQMKELAGGEEGFNWNHFSSALGAK